MPVLILGGLSLFLVGIFVGTLQTNPRIPIPSNKGNIAKGNIAKGYVAKGYVNSKIDYLHYDKEEIANECIDNKCDYLQYIEHGHFNQM